MIRILLVHDERLLRSALADRLARESDLEVFHARWRTASAHARSSCPDVCVADLDWSDPYNRPSLGELQRVGAEPRGGNGRGDGSGTAAGLRPPSDSGSCRLLVLAAANRPGPLRHAVQARAFGYVNKDGTVEQLLTAIRLVAGGERFVDESLGFAFLKAARMPLTRRELNVLSLVVEGASIAEIAGSLRLSPGTVRNYMAAITRKTGARSRVDAVRISLEEGWL